MEGNQNKKILNTVIICVVSLGVLVAAVFGSMYMIDYFGIDTSVSTQDEVRLEPVDIPNVDGSADVEPMTTPDGNLYTITQDWAELKSINEEIVAWIHIPGTNVNYPVMKHEGDGPGSEYYLHRNYDGSHLYSGSIFIDYRSTQGVNSRNIITHGHKMNSGTMYHDLINYGSYSGDLSYYKDHPTLFFNTPEGNEQWIIFSYYKTNTIKEHGEFFTYLQGEYESDAQFMNYIYNVKVRSLFDVPVPINEDDQIITLSTCSHEYTGFRTVVVARKLRDGESAISYVKNATLAENPVWPDVYYTNHAGSRPEITTFKTELSEGNIDWYDGSGDLKGNEWLITSEGASSYIVTFINYDGSIISTQTVAHGTKAYPPKDPVKPSDDYFDYVFKGWQLDFTTVTCNMTVAPIFEPVPKEQ
ncbi:MAG: sortase [Clostridia bacterium]|nr:sortase [Clostridia bacterium]